MIIVSINEINNLKGIQFTGCENILADQDVEIGESENEGSIIESVYPSKPESPCCIEVVGFQKVKGMFRANMVLPSCFFSTVWSYAIPVVL